MAADIEEVVEIEEVACKAHVAVVVADTIKVEKAKMKDINLISKNQRDIRIEAVAAIMIIIAEVDFRIEVEAVIMTTEDMITMGATATIEAVVVMIATAVEMRVTTTTAVIAADTEGRITNRTNAPKPTILFSLTKLHMLTSTSKKESITNSTREEVAILIKEGALTTTEAVEVIDKNNGF